MRILLVEDEEKVSRFVTLGQNAEQFVVDNTKDGITGYEMATERPVTTAIVFFPVTFLSSVSVFLFSALASAVVLSLFASYFAAMTVVPLFCAKLIKAHQLHAASGEAHQPPQGYGQDLTRGSMIASMTKVVLQRFRGENHVW